MYVIYVVCTFCFPSEALWQPARKTRVNENRKPIYVFSTFLANSAGEAVMKNRYDSIIQFHNAQPKGPGFLRLPVPKSEVDSARKTSESEREREREGSERAPKRRSSRLSTNEETPITKKLRSGGQMKSPMSEDSKHAVTRFSRRLRKQQRTSCSPPSSPSSGHSSSDSQPSPVSHRGRGGQRSSRGAGRRGGGGGRGGAGRGVGRGGGRESTMVNSGQREEEDEGEESEEGEEAKEMSVSKDSENGEEVRQEEEEEDSEVEEMDRQPRDVYDDRQEPSSHELAQESAHHASTQQYQGEEDNNYTICHGTPRGKGSGAVDMSSPASKLTSQTLASKTVEISSSSGAVSTTPPSALPHRTQHDGLGVGEQQKQLSSSLSSGAVGSGNRSQDPMLGQHSAVLHKEASVNNWPGGLGPQFSHVPSGYYSAGIHPVHYPGHPAQHVPGANYPYGVYQWGHPAVGREQHPYVSHSETAQQHTRSAASSQASHSAHTASHTASSHVAYQHHAQSPHHSHSAASTPGETNKEPSSASSQGNEAVMKPPSSHEKHSLPSTHPHSHSSLRQLPGGPGSPQAPLSQVHHAFPRPPHALTTEQISAGTAMHHPAAFPYGFDPSNPAALQHMHHLWQQSQMQQHQIRAGVHPSQLPPHLQHSAAATGMWYPHVQQLMHSIPDDSAKRRAAAAQTAAGSKHPSVDGSTLRMNANRNNSNNNGSNVSSVIASDTRDSAIPAFSNTQGSPSLHRASPTTTGRRLPPHAYSLLSHRDRDLTATSQQALGWTGHSTDVQKNAHLPSSFPR